MDIFEDLHYLGHYCYSLCDFLDYDGDLEDFLLVDYDWVGGLFYDAIDYV